MFLNSDDLYEPDLPLLKNRAHGGTLTLWKSELDPFITILPSETSRISAIVLDMPGQQTTVHINIYLPTSGKEAEFIASLGTLQAVIDDAKEAHPTAHIYVKGDANASPVPRPNNKRDQVFRAFLESNNFLQLSLNNHKTYHHFLGDGNSDSSIDVCLSSAPISSDGSPSSPEEMLLGIICCRDDIRASNSHHDIILSSVQLVAKDASSKEPVPDIPTTENTRHRVIWSEERLQEYCDLLHPVLAELQDTWLADKSPSTLSVLLEHTNNTLSAAAKATQKIIFLNKEHKDRRPSIPDDLKVASAQHNYNHAALKKLLSDPNNHVDDVAEAKFHFNKSRAILQNLKRQYSVSKDAERDEKLMDMLSKNPRSLMSSIRASKRNSVTLNQLHVGNDIFTGKDVGKGFFTSISNLKSRDHDSLDSCQTFQDFVTEHRHV